MILAIQTAILPDLEAPIVPKLSPSDFRRLVWMRWEWPDKVTAEHAGRCPHRVYEVRTNLDLGKYGNWKYRRPRQVNTEQARIPKKRTRPAAKVVCNPQTDEERFAKLVGSLYITHEQRLERMLYGSGGSDMPRVSLSIADTEE